MATELYLLRYERIASYILIISYIFVILSAVKSEQLIVKEQKADNAPGPSPSQLVTIAALLETIGHSILAALATERLKQRGDQIKSGESSLPIQPNLKITIGTWGNALSSLLTAIGSSERVQEEAPITIL